MGRDVTKLHPTLQAKIKQLIKECKAVGITIEIGECLRTVAEQDALYAKGRTAPGSIVTNAKGKSYSSMHQWGVAFDFYLKMDIDGDGKTSDDVYNNATKAFNKVGAIGKKLGLEWGGDWKSIKDLPHLQLSTWGSTPSQLKKKYGTFEAFRRTWSGVSKTKRPSKKTNVVTYSKSNTASADKKNKAFAGNYKVSTALRLRSGASTKDAIITVIPKSGKVTCHGYYSTDKAGTTWYYVEYGKYTGFVSASYCQKTK